MVINTNISALMTSSNLQTSSSELQKSLARLSSGSKLNAPSDDAAGLAVTTRLDAHVNRLKAARSNVGNAMSFTQTQDGYLQKVAKALDRMGELGVLAQDVSKTDADRTLYNTEFSALSAYITDTATKDFNGISLFSSTSLTVTTDGDGQTFSMAGINLGAASYTAVTSSSVSTTSLAATAVTNVRNAITKLSTDRANVGAYHSRLTHTSDQLATSAENLTSASSRIKDVDVAEESTRYARNNILVQAGTAMLAQANQLPQSVLKLLQ